MARVLLGVSGGIAAYKALELARLATLAGHGVRVLMTETATRFVGAAFKAEDEADLLRRAMGSKRGIERIESIKAGLYAGMAARGLHGVKADAIYNKINSM